MQDCHETGCGSGFLVQGTRAQLGLAALFLSCLLKYISVSGPVLNKSPYAVDFESWMSLKQYGPWRAPGERGH